MGNAAPSDALTGIFLLLLRSGLYGQPVAADRLAALTPEHWNILLSMARRQTVTGVLASAVEQLPGEVKVPAAIDYALMAETDRLEANYLKMSRAVASLTQRLLAEGLHPVYLKGLECARFYPVPERRELGDIDLWLPHSRDHHFTHEGFDVDVHSRYYDLYRQHAGLPEIPSPEAELLMLNVHILKHACSAGVGLRQLCDMALAYSALPYNPGLYREACRRAGVLRWTRLLSSFLNQYLGADAPLFGLPAPDPAPLLKIVRRGGNFGHHNPSRLEALSRRPFLRKADTFWRILCATPFSLRYAPGTVSGLLATLFKGNLGA